MKNFQNSEKSYETNVTLKKTQTKRGNIKI